jgi:hypothetical protein
VLEPTAFEVELAIEDLSRQESPGSDEIPRELTKAVSNTNPYEIHKLIFLFGIRRNCLRCGRS